VPAAIATGIDLTGTTLTFKTDPSHYNSGANVWINDADQVVAQRTFRGKVGPAVFLDQSQVKNIVYEGGANKDTFRNNTDIASFFSRQEQQDTYSSGINADRPPSTITGFQITSRFTDGRLPDSSADPRARRDGKPIGGKNEAPPLAWTAHPDAQGYAVVVKDISVPGENPSDPKGTHFHQVLYNIPVGTTGLSGALPGDTVEGLKYSGPNPPDGKPHTYVTTVYALKTANLPQLPAGATPEQMEEAIKAQSIGQTSLSGKFSADVRPDVWDTQTNTWKT
jgi:phosphatidylethanolamine-binding protein (PEBP) family uncharacterized protein